MKDNIDNESAVIGERLNRLLSQRPHGQDSAAWLSRKAGMSEGAISNILSGKRKKVRLDTLIKFANALETTVDFLAGVTDEPYPSRFNDWPEYAYEIMEALQKLSKARSYELLMMARALVASGPEVNQIIREEIVEMAMDRGDEISLEEADRLIDILQAAETKRNSRTLPGNSSEPNEDST